MSDTQSINVKNMLYAVGNMVFSFIPNCIKACKLLCNHYRIAIYNQPHKIALRETEAEKKKYIIGGIKWYKMGVSYFRTSCEKCGQFNIGWAGFARPLDGIEKAIVTCCHNCFSFEVYDWEWFPDDYRIQDKHVVNMYLEKTLRDWNKRLKAIQSVIDELEAR